MLLQLLKQLCDDFLDVVHLGVERGHDRGEARLERAELVRQRAGRLALRPQLVLPASVTAVSQTGANGVARETYLEMPDEDALEVAGAHSSRVGSATRGHPATLRQNPTGQPAYLSSDPTESKSETSLAVMTTRRWSIVSCDNRGRSATCGPRAQPRPGMLQWQTVSGQGLVRTRIAARRTRIVGTAVETDGSSLRKSRSWSP